MSRCAALAAVLVVAACRSSPPPAPPPPKVKVVQPVVKEITEWDEYTARLDAVQFFEPYVSEALAAHNDTLAHPGDAIDYTDLAHIDSPDDAEEL